MIYFDNSATTQPYDEVIQTFATAAKDYFGNPSSIHGLGSQAERLLEQSRQVCAKLLGVQLNEIIFTSGGTEGNNVAIKGVAYQNKNRGKHVITSEVEHAASYEAFKQLENEGFEVTYLPVDKDGRISLKDLEEAIRNDTILVSLIHVNNEMGTIQPIEKAAQLIKKFPKALFHVDHVQGIGKVTLSLSEIDLCTISGHKFHGLKGTGILFVRQGVRLTPLFKGGQQEQNMRAGTENVAGFAALTKALRMTLEKMDKEKKQLLQIREIIIEELLQIQGTVVNTPVHLSAPHIINFSVPGVKPEVLIHSLEEHDIYASSKSACSSKLAQASRVLLACGLGEERASSGIRISLSYQNTETEARKFIKVLQEVIPKLQTVMR